MKVLNLHGVVVAYTTLLHTKPRVPMEEGVVGVSELTIETQSLSDMSTATLLRRLILESY
jgi:hypothetical protein